MTATNQKIAIVTGGATGLGFAIAEAFVRHNIFTIIIGRRQQMLLGAKEKLGNLCEAVVFDVTRLEDIPALIDDITTRHGKIDILVNNAGINLKKELQDVTDNEFNDILFTNVNAVFTLSREVVKKMLLNKTGCIVNISSMASQYGLPKVIAYSASKSAIEGMTRAMAVELGPKGIRVNCIAPGFIATDMSAKALNSDEERMRKVLSRTPLGGLGQPADIGEAALFLVSDAAKYVTGIVMPVDGGNSIGF